MTDNMNAIASHYTTEDLPDQILRALRAEGIDTDNLQQEHIRSFEEFHIGGRKETLALASMAGITANSRILDIGCGIGGPARTLASELGCHVTGIDLTLPYIRAAEMLSERVGLADKNAFQHGSALDLPFDAAAFDVVWTQHTVMNIEDRRQFYSEIKRVLKPGGNLVFHDIMAGNGDPLHFPVMWASDPSLSFLFTPDDTKALLADLGFTIERWEDTTPRSLDWFKGVVASLEAGTGPKLGLNVVTGGDIHQKAVNVTRNLMEGRIVVAQACCPIS